MAPLIILLHGSVLRFVFYGYHFPQYGEMNNQPTNQTTNQPTNQPANLTQPNRID
jgi:hypothetical protein